MTLHSLARRPAALAVQALALAAVVGGVGAWTVSDKSVTLTVDGVPRAVSTHGSTVGDVLDGAHLRVGPHDLLAPAPGTAVHDGSRVVLRRGRALDLVVDGTRRTVWTTATSVDEALGQVGLRTRGALLSASRSRALPVTGLSLDVRLPKVLTLVLAGRMQRSTTTARTVGDALAALHVRVGPADRLSVPATTVVRDGLSVRLVRVTTRRATTSVPIANRTVRRADPQRYRGTTRVLAAGHRGTLRRTYTLLLADGRLTRRTLVSSVPVVRPAPRVVGVGTRRRPVPVGDGLNWAALAACESGRDGSGSVSSSSSYRGLYQFDRATWASVGGSGDPAAASYAEQTARAQRLYAREGRSPWPVCGKHL